MTNTEKPTTIAEKKKSGVVKTLNTQPVPKVPVDKSKVIADKKQETKNSPSPVENTEQNKKSEEKEIKKEASDTKKETPKKPVKTKPKVKRDYAVVNAKSLPISAKHSTAICRFIKNKKIETAIEILEDVLVQKKAVPMKGEIPHRKGAMMSGRYPQKAVGHFIKLLKNLEANAIVNELDEPVIIEAIANLAQRPYGRFGKTKKKRTHVRIKCVEKKNKK